MTGRSAVAVFVLSLSSTALSQLVIKARLTTAASDTAETGTLAATLMRAISDPWTWLGIVLVLIGVVCWYLAMIRLPLSLMLPMAGVIAPVVSVLACVLLGEQVSAAKMAAIATITSGVIWLGWLNA
jgi:drug/metabolite transporter (DMT)-like permease